MIGERQENEQYHVIYYIYNFIQKNAQYVNNYIAICNNHMTWITYDHYTDDTY